MTTNLSELRSTLARLESYELPESLQSSTDALIDKENIEERYEKARDEYLRKRYHQVFYEHLSTFDGHSVPFPDVPSEEEVCQLRQSHVEAQHKLEETARRVYENYQVLQSKYETFVRRREETARMIADMEESVFDEDDKENEDIDVNEQDLVAEEQKCMALAKRKNELLLQLTRKKADLANKEKKLTETTAALEVIRNTNLHLPIVTHENLADFEAETDAMERQVAKYNDIADWYNGMRVVTEELTGVKIMSVTNAENAKDILLTVQLLGAHQLEIRLRPDPRRQSNLRVQSTTFLTPTLIKAPWVENTSPLELRIPDMDDLIRLGGNMGPIEDLRFLLREAVARISVTIARVDELAVLRQKYLTKVGVLHHSGHSFGGEDQEVVCSMNEGVTVVVRLTPDCPIVNGSVYVDQIVGVSGWDQELLEDLKENLNEVRHRGPVKLMEALKAELVRLQETGAVSLPATPTMPKRCR
jgi:hypothetical protein